MKHIVSVSTGLSSALAGERVINSYGEENTIPVFMNTKIEDADNYRFLNEIQTRWNIPLVILEEGRTPYEVSKDQRIIPNQKIAPCTHVLKIEMFVKWLEAQERPSTIHIGYDFTEMHRIDATKNNYEALGHQVDFPLLWKPYEYRPYTLVSKQDWSIEPPRMYAMGYTHANCGGVCVKQGQGDWIRTLINWPDRFADAESWEQDMRTLSDKHANYALLRDQTGKKVTAFTLKELRERYEASPQNPLELDTRSACVVCGIGA